MKYRACCAYNLIVANGNTLEHIDETKRSGGMEKRVRRRKEENERAREKEEKDEEDGRT